MNTKYPIILVHGLMIKQSKILKAFGKIEKVLDEAGYDVYVSDHDAYGSIENNAEQLKSYILNVLEKTGAEKVNIISHSKGGLDSKYMIENLGMEDKVASLTTLCTPHKGSVVASVIWKLPMWIKKVIAFFINSFYKLFLGDKHPDAIKACDQLRKNDNYEKTVGFSDKVCCQSFSAHMEKPKDCFILAIPNKLYKKYDKIDNDGLVCHESAKFGNYRGECLDIPVSHAQIIDLFASKDQKQQVYEFYKKLCCELCEMGF